MADSEPAAYSAPVSSGLLASAAQVAGMASGLIVGFAIGAGGLGVTALGWVADRYGLPAALWISALTPLLAVAATRLLPAPRVQEAR